MPCAAFEYRLLDYSDLAPADRANVDGHVRGCTACREYLETLTQLDDELSASLAGLKPSRVLSARIPAGSRVERPNALPELLDFVGLAAVASIFCVLAWWTLTTMMLPEFVVMYAPYAALLVVTAVAMWLGVRSWRDLQE